MTSKKVIRLDEYRAEKERKEQEQEHRLFGVGDKVTMPAPDTLILSPRGGDMDDYITVCTDSGDGDDDIVIANLVDFDPNPSEEDD